MSNSTHQSQPPQAAVDQIIGLYNQGQLEQTVALAESLAKQYPDALILYDLLGATYMGLGNTKKTVESYQKALRLNPNHTDAYNNMGMALYDQDKFNEAVESYQKAVNIEPDFADAHYNLGNALKQTGDLKQAIESYKASLAIIPDDAEVMFNYGIALKEKGDQNEAINWFKQIIKINPDYAEVYNSLGNVLNDKGDTDTAIDSYKQAIRIKPDYAEAYSNMGISLKDKGDLDAAIDSYKQALKIKPNYADAHNNMGIALQEKGDTDAAIDSYKQALKIKLDHADAHNNMGIALQDRGDTDTAIDSYKQSIGHKPDHAEAHLNLSFALLNIGRLKEGLDEYEWRWRTAKLISKERRFSKPMWDGTQPLKSKTILLWGEQGPGDVVMWSSCLPHLSFGAGRCILECPEKLVPLFARSFPNVEVKAENKSLDTERDDFDFHLPMGSLFRHFVPEISENTKPDAFLVPDSTRVNFWRDRLNSLGKGLFVGISWKSPVITPDRLPNYTQISDWAPVFSLPNVTFINLQSTNFADDLTLVQNKFGIAFHNFDDLDHYDDLADVAALSAALDIVVSVSTAVSTISAGVGTPTKLLHWRQSYWNNILFTPPGPSVDVFERNTWEPWDEIFRSIAKDIASYQHA